MANTEMLRKRISDAGTTITAVSKAIGMSRENFYNRLRSGEFTVSEMIQISDFLRLTEEEKEAIFFANERETYSRK